MAARTQRTARRKFPERRRIARRSMPGTCRSATKVFDAVFCCYLLELLRRRHRRARCASSAACCATTARLTLVLIGQNTAVFNPSIKLARVAPAFWGRQVERACPS